MGFLIECTYSDEATILTRRMVLELKQKKEDCLTKDELGELKSLIKKDKDTFRKVIRFVKDFKDNNLMDPQFQNKILAVGVNEYNALQYHVKNGYFDGFKVRLEKNMPEDYMFIHYE